MKLKVTINGVELIVMFDPGATHNFIPLGTVSKLHIPISPSGDFTVSSGNGGTVGATGNVRMCF